MQRSKFSYVLFLIGLLAVLIPNSALADVAPPAVPDGENINPGEGTTMVQMVAEEVIIDVSLTLDTVYSEINGFSIGGYIVAYNCKFWLENKGTETENLAVRFPINNDYEYGKINIHSIKVNGQSVPWIEDTVDPWDANDFNWAHFDVVFPPEQEVEVKITYTSVTHGWPGNPRHSVSYILETGAGWYGPIGKGKIILRFPYNAAPENVFPGYFETPEGIFTESDVYWEFTDLEPTRKDNWNVQIVVPDLWLEILATRKKLETSPNNFSALFRLAENISNATIYRGEIYSDTLFEEGLDAIRRAIELIPGSIESHELFIMYLLAYDTIDYYLLALEEIEIILELDPENQTADWSRELALSYLERYQTATARAMATSTSTSTPVPTSTLKLNTPTTTIGPLPETTSTEIPYQSATPKVNDDSISSSPINVIGLILVILVLLLIGGWRVNRGIERK